MCIAPLCNTSFSTLGGAELYPALIGYNTNIFISQLLSTFNSTDRFDYVCQHIGFNMVASFPINDLQVVDAICKAAGSQTKPRPEATLPWAPNNAVRAAQNTASVLFSVLWAAAATTDSQLNIACARAPDYVDPLNKEHLNGTLIESTLCGISDPIPAKRAQNTMKTWMSRYFTTVLENISQVDGWRSWLCDNIDPDMLDLAGTYGYGIQMQICNDSSSYIDADISRL